MMKNHKLAGSISDASFYLFKHMLKYKTKSRGSKLRKVNKIYPS